MAQDFTEANGATCRGQQRRKQKLASDTATMLEAESHVTKFR